MLYISLPELKVRLLGKVAFAEQGEDDPNKMSNELAIMLMDQAEGDVELDLSPRYATPFTNAANQGFGFLPSRPTRQVIKTLCLNKACLYVLDTDFGRGSAISGEEYAKGLTKTYDSLIKRLIGVIGGDSGETDFYRQWKFPPLPGLALAAHNACSDDGFAGRIFHTTTGEGGYAADAVNDPSRNFYTALTMLESDALCDDYNPYGN